MKYELIIIGAGPAGLTASIYASRFKIKHLIIGKLIGGLASQAHFVENYPGYLKISGQDLMKNFIEQVKYYKPEIEEDEVIEILKRKEGFELKTLKGKNFFSKALIIATGSERRKLNIKGELEFWGKGVTYCATCDAPLYKEKIVAVIGGGNAALTAALLLADYAKKVYLIHRGKNYSAELIWQERVLKNEKIERIYQTNVIEIKGEKVVREIILDKPYKNSKIISVDGVFIEIGSIPLSILGKKIGLKLDKDGFIIVDKNCQTNVKGVFAAGDVTNYTNLKQILTASSQGAIAAFSVYQFLNKK
jgi:thioredoxin reductase (NADPH)